MTMEDHGLGERSRDGHRRLLLLGATGGTGRHVLEQALARGHRITAFVRAPEKLSPHGGLTVVRGDPRDAAALAAAAAEHDVMISALGPRTRHDEALMPACVDSLVTASRDADVRRVLLVSSALLFPGTGLAGAVFRWLLRGSLRGAREAEHRLMRSGLDWTIARPVRLTDSPGSGAYRVETARLPPKPRPIARADVARFLLDALESRARTGAIVGLCR
jgi:uncharacterized protein YbjT (DUF2867 family)